MEVLGSYWATPQGSCIGIIVVDNGYETRAYIGVGNGQDEDADIELIGRQGSPFPLDVAKKLCRLE